MQYNQPYGVTDTNAPYINGNPSTGTMGSIPPAASIEYPQREIVNFETDSGLAPTNGDLHQLSKSVQGGQVNWEIDQGTPNFIAITPTPAVTAYFPGLHFRIQLANNNTGPTKVNVSNVGFAPLVHSSDQSDLGAELFANQVIEITWDGTHWQILSGGGGAGGSSGAIILTAPKVFYVNGTTGSDTLYDGSQPTVDVTNKHGPFATLQKAQNTTYLYNLNGYSITINVANGAYGPVSCGVVNGSGAVYYVGNTATPSAVVITNNAGPCFTVSGRVYSIDGFTVNATGHSPGATGAGIYVVTEGVCVINTLNCAYCIDAQIQMDGGGFVSYVGPIYISGSATYHISVINQSYIRQALPPTPVYVTAAVNYAGAYIDAMGNSVAQVSCTWSGFANVTGQKFVATVNGVINTGGAGINHFPGTVAGGTSLGGQYV